MDLKFKNEIKKTKGPEREHRIKRTDSRISSEVQSLETFAGIAFSQIQDPECLFHLKLTPSVYLS